MCVCVCVCVCAGVISMCLVLIDHTEIVDKALELQAAVNPPTGSMGNVYERLPK